MFTRFAPAAVVCGALFLGGLAGCETFEGSNELGPVTPAEKTKVTSERLSRASKVMTKGEKLITEGEAERAKGLSMRQMGKTIDAEKYIANGESKIRQGQTMVAQARQYRADTLAQAQRNTDAEQAAYKMQSKEIQEQTKEIQESERLQTPNVQEKTTPSNPPPSQP